jgi:hypothetical protein
MKALRFSRERIEKVMRATNIRKVYEGNVGSNQLLGGLTTTAGAPEAWQLDISTSVARSSKQRRSISLL